MATVENKTFEEIQIGDRATVERQLTEKEIQALAALYGNIDPTLNMKWFQCQELIKHRYPRGYTLEGVGLAVSLVRSKLPGPGGHFLSIEIQCLGRILIGDTVRVTLEVTEKIDAEKAVVLKCLGKNQRDETFFTGRIKVLAPPEKLCVRSEETFEIDVYRDKHVFNDIIEQCGTLDPIDVAVCHPCSDTALRGAVEAAERGLVKPILIGPAQTIRQVAQEGEIDLSPYAIVNTVDIKESAAKAVSLCREGKAEALMKGSLHTDIMMRQVMQRDTGLRTGNRISHVFVASAPAYPRPLLITDAAINIYPKLEDKAAIIQNAIHLAHCMGAPEPRVAILSAVETVNPEIESTIEAAALCKMADRGQITGGILDGPLAFDNAVSEEAARIKKIVSPVAGRADIFVVPDLEAGNMLAKQLEYLAEAEMAGIVLGARVPIILTSRADSARTRLASCAVGAMIAHATRRGKCAVVGKGG